MRGRNALEQYAINALDEIKQEKEFLKGVTISCSPTVRDYTVQFYLSYKNRTLISDQYDIVELTYDYVKKLVNLLVDSIDEEELKEVRSWQDFIAY